MRKNLKRLNRRTKNILLILIKVDKGKGGGGIRMWIKKFLNVNIINFKKEDKPRRGEGVGQCG